METMKIWNIQNKFFKFKSFNCLKIPENPLDSLRIPYNSLKPFIILATLLKYLKNTHKISQNPLNPLKSFKIRWNPLESPEIP